MGKQDAGEEIRRWNREGGACLESGDLEGALERFTRSLELMAGEDVNRRDRAGILNNIAMVQVQLGRYGDARISFQKAAADYREAGDPVSAAWQMGNAGSTCRDMELHDEALEHYHESLAVFSREGLGMGTADQSGNIGYIHAMKNDPQSALEWFEKALELYLQEEGAERKADLTRKNIESLRSTLQEQS